MRSANLAELCDLGREVKSPQSQTSLKKGQGGKGGGSVSNALSVGKEVESAPAPRDTQ